ncbi:MAG: PKD domain-containing protein, partial [Acidimicrobiia bacterium]
QIGDTARKTFTANYDHVVIDTTPGDGGGTPTDTDAPTVPGTPVASSPSVGTVLVSWAGSSDVSTPITYRIYRDGNGTPVGQTTSLSFTDSGRTPGASHSYRVDAVDAVGNASGLSGVSNTVVVQSPVADTDPPTVPGVPSGSSPSSSSIQIGWAGSSDPSTPITYRIYRDGNATPVGTSTTTSFTDTGLAAGSSHTYEVDAVDAQDNASAKSAVSASITVQAAGTAVWTEEFANLSSWTATRVTLSTTAGSPAQPSARIQTSNQSASAYRTISPAMTQLCASVNVNLASGNNFDLFRLRTSGNGALLKVFVASNGRLGIRSDFAGSSRTSTTTLGTGWHNVELCGTVGTNTSWDLYRDGVLIIDGYQVSTGTTGAGRIQIGDTARKTFTANYDHVVIDTTPGDGGGTPTDTDAPTVPGTPAGTSPTTGQIQISWTASSDVSTPITYRIYRDGNATPVGQTTTLSFTDTGLTAGTNHTYTVDAVDAVGNASAQSASSMQITVINGAAGLQPTPNHTRIANDVVSTNMPRITDGEMWDIEYIGTKVYVAGGFTSIRNNANGNTTSYSQRFLAAFDMNTGLVDPNFRPTFDGGVTNIEASPDGTKLIVVGTFNTVNGVTKRKIASIDPTTGATVAGFTAQGDAQVSSVDVSNTTVYVGGRFTAINGVPRASLAALNINTGAVITGFVNDLAGGIGVNGGLTVQDLTLSHDGTKLLVVHTGTTINGQTRMGPALIDTTTNQLLPWRSRLWDDNLQFVGGITRIYAGDIAPNDQYFVVSSGSGGDRPPISDTIVAYPMSGGDDVQPLWISRAFDSVYSLAVTEQAIYIGGHFNYNESPTAPDPWPGLTDTGYGRGQGLAGYGLGDDIVLRDHVGALNPVDGKAVEWNPGSNSFEGNKVMKALPRGVITGGDATTQGEANVGRVAFYDFNTIPAVGPNETVIVDPIEGRVEPAGTPFTISGTASATSGVQRVQVEIRDRDTNRYLNDDLTTWAANGVGNTINATLASPGATNTSWSLTLNIPENRRLMIYARTVGNNGSQDSSKAIKRIETFGLADETPTTRVSGPSGSVIPTTTFTVTGSATDDLGVQSITFTLRDVQNRYLQDDGSTSATYNTFRGVPDVVGAPSTTWSYEFTVPYEGEWTLQAIAVDTSGQSDLRSADRTWIVSDTAISPTVTIQTPGEMIPPTAAPTLTLAPGSPITFSGTATDDEGLDYVMIYLQNTSTRENLSAGGVWGSDQIAGAHRISGSNSIPGTTYNWSYTTPFNLTTGVYSFIVGAVDDLGLRTASSNYGRLTINVQVPGDAFPDTTITPTGTQTGLQSLHLDLTGSATDDIGVASVKVTVQDRDTSRYLQPNGTMQAGFTLLNATLANPGATSTTWTLPVDLPTEGDYSVTAYAYDTSDQQDASSSGATSRYPIYPGDQPPTVTETLLTPADGDAFTDGKIFVSGRVEDDRQIAEAQVAIRNAAGQYMSSSGAFSSTNPSWRNAFLNSPGSPGSNFSYTTPLIPPGSYTVLVRGEDSHGFVTLVPSERVVTVTNDTSNLPPVANFTYTCTQNVCTFDGRTSTDENAPALTYSWNFGNGSGSGPLPTRTYTSANSYTVTLTVRDENGLSGVTSKTVTIVEPAGNLPPNAVFNTPACTARTCNFSASGSTDPNTGDSISYLWNFGDGGPTSSSTSTSKTFAADGIYTVTLTATDGWGKSTTVTRTLDITEPGDNVAPTPVIGGPNCSARTCAFFATGSSDVNGGPLTYAWAFGDGATSTSVSPTRVYAADGDYTVTLTVTDAWGKSAEVTKDVAIHEPDGNAAPVPVIGAPSCVAKTCSLSSAGSADPDGDSFTYLWNFGDGTATSTLSAPSHTFPGVGPYTVTLTLTDAWGKVGTITTEVSFTAPADNDAPVAVIATPVCTARSCTFSATGSADPDGDTYTYLWDFGTTPATTST